MSTTYADLERLAEEKLVSLRAQMDTATTQLHDVQQQIAAATAVQAQVEAERAATAQRLTETQAQLTAAQHGLTAAQQRQLATLQAAETQAADRVAAAEQAEAGQQHRAQELHTLLQRLLSVIRDLRHVLSETAEGQRGGYAATEAALHALEAACAPAPTSPH